MIAKHPASVRAVVFCDDEGERVEAVHNDDSLEVYDVDAFGATYSLAASRMPEGTNYLEVRTENGTVLLRTLGAGYYLLAFCTDSWISAPLKSTFYDLGDALQEQM